MSVASEPPALAHRGMPFGRSVDLAASAMERVIAAFAQAKQRRARSANAPADPPMPIVDEEELASDLEEELIIAERGRTIPQRGAVEDELPRPTIAPRPRPTDEFERLPPSPPVRSAPGVGAAAPTQLQSTPASNAPSTAPRERANRHDDAARSADNAVDHHARTPTPPEAPVHRERTLEPIIEVVTRNALRTAATESPHEEMSPGQRSTLTITPTMSVTRSSGGAFAHTRSTPLKSMRVAQQSASPASRDTHVTELVVQAPAPIAKGAPMGAPQPRANDAALPDLAAQIAELSRQAAQTPRREQVSIGAVQVIVRAPPAPASAASPASAAQSSAQAPAARPAYRSAWASYHRRVD